MIFIEFSLFVIGLLSFVRILSGSVTIPPINRRQ